MDDDFWPKDFPKAESITTPVQIVIKQAELLSSKTGGRLRGEVVRLPQETAKKYGLGFMYAFHLHAPSMDYRYRLFMFGNNIDLYPCTMLLEATIKRELFEKPADADEPIKSEEEFKSLLKRILSSERTRKIIIGIMSLEDTDGLADVVPF